MEAVQLRPVEVMMKWTAKRKAELVVDMLKGVKQMHEVCREHDLKQSTVEQWTKDFIETGTKGLKLRGPDEKVLRESEIKDLRAKIGELVLENEILKKSQEILERMKAGEELEESSSPSKKS